MGLEMDWDELNRYEERGALRHSVDPVRGLHVWCYTQATVYRQDWDHVTRACRGLVTDAEGHVLSRPFPKFFNWGQPLAPGPEVTGNPFWAYDKEDGTLIVVGRDVDGEAIVSTKGSFSTWHSEAARDLLKGWKPVEGSTALFEFIHPKNRIVVDYGDREELVMLGAVAHADGCDHFQPEDYAEESGWFGSTVRPNALHLPTLLRDVQNPENGINREGFVLVWPNPDGPSHRVKVKFAQYMQLHATLSKVSNVAVWESLSTGTFDAFLEVMPDELFDRVRECANELLEQFESRLGSAKAAADYVRDSFTSRKEQAQHIKSEWDHVDSRVAFMLLDGKDPAPVIWKSIRPAFDSSWSFLK